MVVLLTDFGLQDPYVGTMKGVILGICPSARLVDLTHEVRPQNVLQGSFLLERSAPYFPPGTVYLCVVDPGVGSERRPLAVRARDQYFVAPDNGLLSHICEGESVAAVELRDPRYRLAEVSRTFHGRDLFAPAAAHLENGVALSDLGPPVTDLRRLSLPRAVVDRGQVVGTIVHQDRFGNLITDVSADVLTAVFGADPSGLRTVVGKATLRGLVSQYEAVPAGQPLALLGSFRTLEIAVNRGSAHDFCGASIGDSVHVFLEAEGG